jgi:peptidoglycan/LPS O-acetylase OafA/YrhL
MQRITNTQIGYVPGIDGLRAIAVLSVILCHLKSSILPGGFSGVDVFFVISGYVVSGSLARQAASTFPRFALGFYARRIVRIFPALAVCILLVGLLQTLIVPASWLSSSSSKTGLSALFGLSNFALIWFSDGYFSPQAEFNAFTHTWSLGVEEQFYVLFPAVFFFWLKGRERDDAFGRFSRWLLVLLLIVSLLYSWVETAAAPDHAYYLLPSRFWELASGAMLFKLHQHNRFQARTKIGANGYIGAGLLLLGLGFIFSDQKAFPFPWAMLSVSGTLFAITGVVSDFGKASAISRLLDNKVLVYIGKISYSLYLWHWPILVLFRWTVGLETALTIAAALLLTTMMSMLSYHFVERPTRQSRIVKLRPDGYVVTGGLLTIAACAVVSAAVFMAQPQLSLSVTKDRYNWYPESWPSEANASPTAPKVFAGRKMFVMGNSHTGAYSTMLRQLKDQRGVDVHQYLKTGCPIASLLKAPDPECAQLIDQLVAKIEDMAAPGDIVFLASLRMNRFGDQWKTFDESSVVAEQRSADSVAQRLAALQAADILITRLEKASLVVVIDAPKPVFKSPPFRCADWFNASNPVCSAGFMMERSFLLEHRKPIMESLDALKRNHPALVVWDPFPALCPSEFCTAFDGRLPLFFDGDHLSAHGNRVLYPNFVSLLKSAWQASPATKHGEP